MRILIAHAGLHKVHRGSEVLLEAVAQEIASRGRHSVVLAGAGSHIEGRSYEYRQLWAPYRTRFEKWPKMPFLRNEYMYEELGFGVALAASGLTRSADITMACGYPYTNLALRSVATPWLRVPHVFVTQNGDWPASGSKGEPTFFSCDGLICTNPVYFERNRRRWPSTLIPNGVDPGLFCPGDAKRKELELPDARPIVLMASAMQNGKRVEQAIRAVARLPGVVLLIAGDGVLSGELDLLAARLLPGRYIRRSYTYQQMPDVYRCADVFLHMTIGESFGNVYIEALCSGVPIVAHDEETTRWILGSHATLVDTRDEDATVRALSAALERKRSASDGASWARDRYSWTSVADKYVEFLEYVVSRNKFS